jgi:hypothetical protein
LLSQAIVVLTGTGGSGCLRELRPAHVGGCCRRIVGWIVGASIETAFSAHVVAWLSLFPLSALLLSNIFPMYSLSSLPTHTRTQIVSLPSDTTHQLRAPWIAWPKL